MLDKAISITAQAFEGKFDKGGEPYIIHCLMVMNQMPSNDPDLRCIAVMHDLIEDTEWEIQELAELGFSTRVTTALTLLTHDHKISYDDYIKTISLSRDATLVKLADLRHNSDIHRMKGLRKKDFERLEKYHRSFAYLSDLYK
jgi:(p)ppGpp synthase/HD superfamily hydrolase